MPNFTVRVTAGATPTEWTDPASGDQPTRLNPVPAHPHIYQLCTIGIPVTLKATVGGTEGPLDAALAGETFTTSIVEVPLWPAPALTLTAGQSSVVSFTPTNIGLHLLMFRRINGGAVGVHLYAASVS